MHDKVLSRSLAVACATLALALAATAPAFAAPRVPIAPRVPLTPANPLGRLGTLAVPAPSALPPGVVVKELPMGGQFSGKVAAGGFHIIEVPMYAGMTMHFELTGAGNHPDWGLELWEYTLDPDNPLAYSYDGNPRVMDHTAGTITDPDTQEVYQAGFYDLYIWAPQAGGSYTLKYTMTDPPVTKPIERIAGTNRYETSVQTAESAFTTASTVVVATGKNYADALAASALCGSYNAPLLLTDPLTLPGAVKTAIDGYAPSTIFVIGDGNAVSEAVVSSLQGPGREVSRIAGVNRYATAAEIAQRVHDHERDEGRTPPTSAFVASGKNFPDALAVSPFAFSQKMPILLTQPTYLPTQTSDAFGKLGITKAYVVGGAPTISDGVMAQLPAATKTRVAGPAGTGRSETAAEAARLGVSSGWANWTYVALATGWNFPDALGGGVAAGKKGGVMLLSKGIYMDGEEPFMVLTENVTSLGTVTLLGGTQTLGGCVMGDMNSIWTDPAF